MEKETNTIHSYWITIQSKLTDVDLWLHVTWVIAQVIMIWLLAIILVKLLSSITEKILNREYKIKFKVDERRAKTLAYLINNILRYTIYFLAILMILGKLNFNLGPLLAGAGVVGLAIGFGAQNLVKDVITGFFIVFEDQFGVGDYITVGDYTGTVEELGLRVTKIRKWTGELHIVPNGNISEVTNYSTHNSIAVIDVSVAYEEKVDEVITILQTILNDACKEMKDIVKCPEVLGVQELGKSEVVIRVIAETGPMMHYVASRKIKEIIKEGLNKEGIEIPYPKLVTYHRSEG